MSNKLNKSTSPRLKVRTLRRQRITRKVGQRRGERPRLYVFRSNRFIYSQLIDDATGQVIVQANTREKEFEGLSSKKDLKAAESLGKRIAEKAKSKDVTKIYFDRGGYDYHGRVKSLADAAREAGLEF